MKPFKIVHKPGEKAHLQVSVFEGDVTSPEGYTVTVVEAPTPQEAIALWKASELVVPPAAVTAEIRAKQVAEEERAMTLLVEEALSENSLRSVRTFESFMALSEAERWRVLFATAKHLRPSVVEAGKTEEEKGKKPH